MILIFYCVSIEILFRKLIFSWFLASVIAWYFKIGIGLIFCIEEKIAKELFCMVQMKLYANFQSLHGVSILSFEEAKETFLTPVKGNINFYLQESFCMVQMKFNENFQSPK